jgi:hypothetical protein
MAITPALIAHVSAGSIGILSGAVALSVRKGGRLHTARFLLPWPSSLPT